MSKGGARPGAGRKRKAPELKALTGNLRKDRENAVGEAAPAGAMICPLHLDDLEQLYFGSTAKILEEQGRASPHHSEAVALLAQRFAQIERWKAVLACAGDTYESHNEDTGTTLIRARPEVAMLNEAMRHAQSLLGELMLTPATALRIASGHKSEAGAFDDF